jgi:mannose-6-phosphate isomerase-like protein (cupin superfamily)
MKVQGKVWGVTYPLFANANVEMHSLRIKKGGFCSRHYHKTKYNRFIVFSGQLKVTVWKNYGSEVLEDITILDPNMECTVEPGDEHMFEALEETVAVEIYYVDLHANDIVRKNHGGMKDVQ